MSLLSNTDLLNESEQLPSVLKLKLKVTPELIGAGVRNDPDWCPIALAGKRETEMDFRVGITHATIWDGEGENIVYSASLPDWVKEWVTHFDGGAPVYPMEVELEFRPYVNDQPDGE